jgi:hypothetical protein
MKKYITIPLLLFALHLTAFPQDRSDFDAKVDFSITLKTLNQLMEQGRGGTLPTDKYIILSGTISDIAILDKNTNTYTVQLTLTGGEWISPEQVKSYQAFIRFSGPEYKRLFGTRQIGINSTVILVAKIISPTTTYNGKKIWLLKGYHIRVLQ